MDTFGLGHGREPLHGGLSQGAEVDRLVDGYRGIGVEPGQEEQVFDDAAEALALGADLAQRAPVARAVAGRAQGQPDLGLYDRERGTELMRGIGGELELALARFFHRLRRHEPDGQGAEEHGQDEHGAGDNFSAVRPPPQHAGSRKALACHDPTRARPGRHQPERAPAQARRRRLAGAGPGAQRQRGGTLGERCGIAVGARPPYHDRHVVNVSIGGKRAKGGHAQPSEPGDVAEPVRHPGVDLGHQVPPVGQVEGHGDPDVQHRQ